MAKFQYIDTGGNKQTVEANSSEEALKNAPNIASSSGVMAVDTLSRQADPNVERGVEVVNDFQSRQGSPTLSRDVANTIATPAPIPTPQTEGDKFRSDARAILDDIEGTDLVSQRRQTREDLQVTQKEEVARNLSNRLIERDRQIQKELERMERNPEGQSRDGLNATLNQFRRESARELADLSFSYNVALGDYQAAEKIAQDYMNDLTQELQLKQQSFNNIMTLMSNDMTESEKLQAQQAFAEKQAQTSFENSKKLAKYNAELQQSDPLYRMKVRASQIELAKLGDSGAIAQLGYDPRDIPATAQDIAQAEQTDLKLNNDLADIRALKENKTAINLSAGALRGNFLSSFLETGIGSAPAKVIKEDFLNEVSRMTGEYTLNNLIAKKAEGATFGALSNAELGIISASASKLNALLDIDPESGAIEGIKGSEKALENALADFETKILNAIDLNNARIGVSDQELLEINSTR